MGLLILVWGVPIGTALLWYAETGQVAPVVATMGTLVWLTIWGLAFREKS